MKRLLAVISGFVLAVLIISGGVLAGQHRTRFGAIPIKTNDVPGFAELLKISFESVVKDKLSTDSVNSLTVGQENENGPLAYEVTIAKADPEQKEDEDHEDENKENNNDEGKTRSERRIYFRPLIKRSDRAIFMMINDLFDGPVPL